MDADPLRAQQDGSDLTITETDSGHRVDGTVSGNQVRLRDREDLFGLETEWKARSATLTDIVVLTVWLVPLPDAFEAVAIESVP